MINVKTQIERLPSNDTAHADCPPKTDGLVFYDDDLPATIGDQHGTVVYRPVDWRYKRALRRRVSMTTLRRIKA